MPEPDDTAAELVLDIVDGSVSLGRAVLEQDHPVTEPLDFLHLVGDHHHGGALGFLLANDVH
jgi:hypothetical protein